MNGYEIVTISLNRGVRRDAGGRAMHRLTVAPVTPGAEAALPESLSLEVEDDTIDELAACLEAAIPAECLSGPILALDHRLLRPEDEGLAVDAILLRAGLADGPVRDTDRVAFPFTAIEDRREIAVYHADGLVEVFSDPVGSYATGPKARVSVAVSGGFREQARTRLAAPPCPLDAPLDVLIESFWAEVNEEFEDPFLRSWDDPYLEDGSAPRFMAGSREALERDTAILFHALLGTDPEAYPISVWHPAKDGPDFGARQIHPGNMLRLRCLDPALEAIAEANQFSCFRHSRGDGDGARRSGYKRMTWGIDLRIDVPSAHACLEAVDRLPKLLSRLRLTPAQIEAILGWRGRPGPTRR